MTAGDRGYRLVYLAEVSPVREILLNRDTPAARELAGELQARWQERYEARVPVTAFKFYPHPVVARLLSDALAEVRAEVRAEMAATS